MSSLTGSPDHATVPVKRERDLLAEVHLSTEEGIYGLILVAGLVAVAGNSGLSSLQTLAFVLVTVGVFWVAHVYSGTVAAHSSQLGLSVRTSLRMARKRSRGLLAAIAPPAVPLVLVLGAVGLINDIIADWIAMWTIVAVLAMLGYLTYRRRDASLGMCLVGAVLTASLGLVVIVAKALLHH